MLLDIPGMKLVRVKAGDAADPNILDPTVPLTPVSGGVGAYVTTGDQLLHTDDPKTTLAWATQVCRSGAPEQPLGRLAIKVTLRDAAGVELPGTWAAVGFAVGAVDPLEVPEGVEYKDVRPAVWNLGAIAAQPTDKPGLLNAGKFGHVGILFTSITPNAGTVAFVYVWAMEWT